MKAVEIVKKIYHIKDREWKLFFKENENDEVIYVVRFFRKEGLMSMLYKALGQIEYSVDNGWVPYIDTQHFNNMYQVKDQNSWECFFTQPELKINNEGRQKKYILGSPSRMGTELFNKYWAFSFEDYSEKSKFLNQHIKLNEKIIERVNNYCKRVDLNKCVGVYCRGTDYVSLKPKGHPVQPSVEEVIEKIEEFLKKEDANIFLVTEDSTIKNRLFNKFPDKLITIDEDIVFDDYHTGKMLADSIEQKNKIEVASVYLMKILCLAKCKRLIASKTNGSLMALIFNGGGYEETYVFDKGFY